MAPALWTVDEPARLDLVEESEGEVRFHHARRLEGCVFVDTDQLGSRGQIVDQPGGALIAANDATAPESLDVALDLGLQIAVDRALCGH